MRCKILIGLASRETRQNKLRLGMEEEEEEEEEETPLKFTATESLMQRRGARLTKLFLDKKDSDIFYLPPGSVFSSAVCLQ